MKILELPGVGPVKVIKSRNARQLSLRVDESGEVRITMPVPVSYRYAEKFLNNQKGFITRTRSEYLSNRVVFNHDSRFATPQRQMFLKAVNHDRLRCVARAESFTIEYPESVGVESSLVQNFIREQIEKILMKEAREILPARLQKLSKACSISYTAVSVRQSKSRWGSCSGMNRINLSKYLLLLPPHLSDYVLVHELCHVLQKNHGKKFWALLERLLPGAKECDTELRKYSAASLDGLLHEL